MSLCLSIEMNTTCHICPSQQTPIQLGAEDARLIDRREFLWRFGGGLGGIALVHLLGQRGLLAETSRPRAEFNGGLHHRAKVKRIIQIFLNGGMSQVDTFDYKPLLEKQHDKDFNPGAGIRVEAVTSAPGKVLWRRWCSMLFPTPERSASTCLSR